MEEHSHPETNEAKKCRSLANKDDLERFEKNLADNLKKQCNENGKEIEPQQSAKILHELGLIYLKRSKLQDNDDHMTMISLIRSACLFNAAITRKPKNLQIVKDDLKTLCNQVLIKANARDKNVDLIGQSNIVKQDIKSMRDMVHKRLDEIQLNQNKPTDKREKEKIKITDIKNLQTDISTSYTNIMAKLLHYCQTVMGDAPCKFSLVGMGSLARKEITPYSDFEHIIVLEQKAEQRSDYKDILNYFRWLSVIFQIVLINLQETIVANVEIPTLKWYYDGFTTHGICFDSMMPHACKFPIGRTQTTNNKQSTTELIKSVDEMLKYLTADEDLKNGYHLKDILTKVCYVGGDKSVFNKFETKLRDILRNETPEEKLNSIKQMLIEDLDNFATRSKLMDLSSTSFNIKKDFYRASTIFISSLGQYHNVEASSCFEISAALETKGIINDNVKHYQMLAVALACELRLKWYMKREEQEDFIQSSPNNQDCIQILLNTMKGSSVVRYFQITYAIQCEVSKLFGLQKIHFYSDPKLLNFKLYYRFKSDQMFKQFVVGYVNKELDKTARLHSAEDIMALLDDDLTPQVELKHKSPFEVQKPTTDIREQILILGLRFEIQESYDEAKELFDIYLDMIEVDQEKKTSKSNSITSNDNQFNNNKKLLLNKIGTCLMHMHNFDEAIDYLQRSLEVYKNASPDLSQDLSFAQALNNIGVCLMQMHKPAEAIGYLQQSQIIYEIASLDLSQDIKFADTLSNIGSCLMHMYKHEEAIVYLRQSKKKYEKASLDQDVRFADILNNIGLCLRDMQKPGEAIGYLQRSLKITEKASPDSTQNVSFSETLNNIGLCLTDLFKPREAISYLLRSLKIYEKVSLDLSRDVRLAQTLNNTGLCLRRMQKPGNAIDYLQRSLKIYKKASLDLSQDVDFAQALNNIGNCLIDTHQPGEANTCLQRSLNIYKNVSLDLSRDVSFAQTLTSIGVCFRKMRRSDEAINYLQQSLKIYEKASLDLSRDVRLAQTLTSISSCFWEMHKPSEAIDYLQRSLKIYEKASSDISEDVRLALTRFHIFLGSIDISK